MPFIIPFIPLIAAGAGLAGTGVAVYDANNASIDQGAAQKANAAALLQQQQASANQANLTKQEAMLGQQGQAQQQTEGSLTDSGTTSFTDLLAGYPGFQGGTSTGTSGISGGASSTTPGSGSSSPSTAVSAILAALQNGSGASSGGAGIGSSSSISGGNWQAPPSTPQSQFELSNSPLG